MDAIRITSEEFIAPDGLILSNKTDKLRLQPSLTYAHHTCNTR